MAETARIAEAWRDATSTRDRLAILQTYLTEGSSR
jgi:hypothetical protein